MSRNDDTTIRNLEGREFRTIYIDYDVDTNPIYVGKHRRPSADTTDMFWEITKFTWTSGDVTLIEVTRGAWDSRTGLFS